MRAQADDTQQQEDRNRSERHRLQKAEEQLAKFHAADYGASQRQSEVTYRLVRGTAVTRGWLRLLSHAWAVISRVIEDLQAGFPEAGSPD